VTLTHGPENVKPQRKLVSENGRFCFEVCAPFFFVNNSKAKMTPILSFFYEQVKD
jgi:hypothetical protein